MARVAHAQVVAAEKGAIVHVINRVVRRCFLLGTDSVTGKDYDHRKVRIEDPQSRRAASPAAAPAHSSPRQSEFKLGLSLLSGERLDDYPEALAHRILV